jgi:glycerophosphoryl diester phosphodiesterase
MKIIAHRGLLQGPDKTKENTIEGVERCLSAGFDVEIDVRYDGNHLLNVGHDSTNFKVIPSWLYNDKLWIHTKDIETFEYLRDTDRNKELNYFYHTNEDFVLTSKGYIWAYPGKIVKDSVWLFPERELEKYNYSCIKSRLFNHIGICTDYPVIMKHIIESE